MTLTRKQQLYFMRRGMEVLTKEEKQLISFYELLWFSRQQVPTVEQVAKHLELTQTKINYYLTRKPVIKALEARGIPWAQHSQDKLTDKQVAAAITVMNFADTRSVEDKLDQLGVNPNQYYAWQSDPQFRNLLQNLADQNLNNIHPTAVAEFTKLVNKGDWKAVRFYLETTGALKNDVPQSEQFILLIIEILQRHIKDPEILLAIAQDIKLASANKTLEVAVGEVITVEDFDISEERKQLGV